MRTRTGSYGNWTSFWDELGILRLLVVDCKIKTRNFADFTLLMAVIMCITGNDNFH